MHERLSVGRKLEFPVFKNDVKIPHKEGHKVSADDKSTKEFSYQRKLERVQSLHELFLLLFSSS
jgi:hypothetical protein